MISLRPDESNPTLRLPAHMAALYREISQSATRSPASKMAEGNPDCLAGLLVLAS